MPWKIFSPPNARHVECIVTGTLPQRDLAVIVSEVAEEARLTERDLLLADCVRFVGGHELFDTFELANKRHEWVEVGLFRKEAIVAPRDASGLEIAAFWETVSANHGYNIKSFKDRAKALAWLEDSASKPQRKVEKK